MNGTIPLFYELCVETTYPVGEGSTEAFLVLLQNVIQSAFLAVPPDNVGGTRWMNWCPSVAGFVFLITLLLLVGVDKVSQKVRKKYVTRASMASLLQAICSLIGASCWSTVHEALLSKKNNCLVQCTSGQIAWAERVDGEADDLSDYGCTADSSSSGQSSVCLADFRYGPAWHALVVASIFTMLLSMDSILSFTKYESELTVSEAMEIAKKKQKQKEREMRFELTAASNPNRDRDATEKLGDSFRSVMHQASVKNLENVGAAMGKQTEEAMMNVGKESLKRIGSVKEMGTGLGKEGMKRMSSVSGFLRSPSSRKTEEKE